MKKQGSPSVNLRTVPKDTFSINDPAKIEEIAFSSRTYQEAIDQLESCYKDYGNDLWAYYDFVWFYNKVATGVLPYQFN